MSAAVITHDDFDDISTLGGATVFDNKYNSFNQYVDGGLLDGVIEGSLTVTCRGGESSDHRYLIFTNTATLEEVQVIPFDL